MKKKQTLEDYKKKINKKVPQEEIKLLAIPWSKFFNEKANWDTYKYDLYLLTNMFIDLLNLVKEKEIKISCGVAMMELFHAYSRYDFSDNTIKIASCKIIPELDFDLGKHELVYNGVILVGKSVSEPNIDYSPCNSNEAFKKVAEEVCPPKKKKSLWQKIFV